MKKVVVLISFVFVVLTYSNAKVIKVVDSGNANPIIGATVIGESGQIIGVTNADGNIDVNGNEFPITLRCVGYNPANVVSDCDIAKMTPAIYNLKEIVVTPAGRPIKRMVCFAREYGSGIAGSDTIQLYTEYMTESFFVDGKVKGYNKQDAVPTPRNHKRYRRTLKEGRDSISISTGNDGLKNISSILLLDFTTAEEKVPEAMLTGNDTYTVAGKYAPKFVYRRKNGLFSKSTDALSDHKGRKWSPNIFKLIGMTIEIDAANHTANYIDRHANSLNIYDLVCATYNLHLIGTGKMFKKMLNTQEPIELDSYMEIYPVEITNLTIEEYKEMKTEPQTIDFKYPDNIRSLSPAIDELIARANAEYAARGLGS